MSSNGGTDGSRRRRRRPRDLTVRGSGSSATGASGPTRVDGQAALRGADPADPADRSVAGAPRAERPARDNRPARDDRPARDERSGRAVRSGDRSGGDRSGGDRTEREWRELTGAGHSQVSLSTALRVRDALRPTPQDLAVAEATVEIRRRNWTPPAAE